MPASASDLKTLRPPVAHPISPEHRRQLAVAISGALDRLDSLEDRVTTSFQGTYDQVADLTTPGGVALTAATNFQPGDYFRLSVSGTFSTALPELSGQTGAPGDEIIATATVWVLLAASTDFLSSVLDDSAAGIITFQKPAKSTLNASAADELTRKDYVDSQNAAQDVVIDGVNTKIEDHIGHGFSAPEDPHGLQAHTGNVDIHFADAPNDGKYYERRNNAWAERPPDLAVMYGAPDNFTLNAITKVLENYPASGDSGTLDNAADASAGTITVASDGLYRITAMVVGTQGNNTKEESMRLLLRVANAGAQNGDYVLSVFDVATDKTADRSFNATFSRGLTAGAILSLAMNATAGMGTFSFETATFEIEDIQSVVTLG